MDMNSLLENCHLCPRECGVNRLVTTGFCDGGRLAKVALVSLHPWEEPLLTGEVGAGTVFFSGCNLHCLFCQNHEISQGGEGVEVTEEQLGEIFWQQQQRGAATLDLVTPTHYVPQIIQGIKLARQKGFSLPVVYNSSGYEKVETLAMLRGYVDVFLPDLKYFASELSGEYSQAQDYFAKAKEALQAMVDLVGPPVINEQGLLTKGVLVRHMVLPGARKDSQKLLAWLWQSFGDQVYLSLMNQYTPMYRAVGHPQLKRRLTTFEYQSVVDYASELGFTQCLVQERSAATENYVPDWDNNLVLPKESE